MKTPTDPGQNRTGIQNSPEDAMRSIEGASADETFGVAQTLSGSELERERLGFSQNAEPVGTMPPPVGVRDDDASVDGSAGVNPMVLLDLLGARLAFERTGTRLYEALLVKHAAASGRPGGPTREELEEIRDDELRHFGLLDEAVRMLGGDPTAVTPSADVQGVASLGVGLVLSDPRTTLTQALEAMLMVELADGDAWATLVTLTRALGHEELAERFADAEREEELHIEKVRGWVQAAVMGQATTAPN